MNRTDHARLGAVRGPVGPRRPMFGRRPRRRAWVLGLTLAAVVATALLRAMVVTEALSPAAAALVERVEDATGADAPTGGIPPVAAAPAVGGAGGPIEQEAEPTRRFARFEDLVLHLPSDDAILVGFHEASRREAMAMEPTGSLIENANPTRFEPPRPDPDGTPYLILSSRGRSPAPTSAADIVLHDEDRVRSPVSGRVVDVRAYQLYGRYLDHRIEIEPDGRTDLRVVLIHITDVAVSRGDRVIAGVTELASPNRFPFGSHIDRYTEPDRWPHVHIEVKRLG